MIFYKMIYDDVRSDLGLGLLTIQLSQVLTFGITHILRAYHEILQEFCWIDNAFLSLKSLSRIHLIDEN